MRLIWIQCTPFFLFICLFCFVLGSSQKQNIITTSDFLRDQETIVSSNETFEMGFFNTDNSSRRYFGIWYHQKDDNGALEVVWVANQDKPLNDSSGVLQISEDGNLQLINGENETIWSSNVNSSTNSSSIAQLQDIGNLVLLENDSGNGNVIWQSFDHPANTLLQHMDVIINEKNMLRSWKSNSDPSSGDFSVGVSIYNLVTEAIILKNDHPYWRSGPWNGNVFIGIPRMRSIFLGGFNVVHQNSNGKFSLTFSSSNQTNFTHYLLTSNGVLDQRDWDNRNRKWETIWSSLNSDCDIYGYCGEFGNCNPMKSPICSCLKGFEPTKKEEWSKGNWTSGCSRRTPLECGTATGKADGFLKQSHMKAPANVTSLYPDDEDCTSRCLKDCTCLAYAYVEGIGCMMWNRNLIDIQEFPADGVNLFIRLADAELVKNKTLQKTILPILIAMGTISLVVVFFLWRLVSRRNAKKNASKSETMHHQNMSNTNISPAELKDMPLYTFEKLVAATNNFQETNKLGRGGFGPVYKGKLEDGQEVAVKRLSNTSGQGVREFMNEVMVISKLQHMNLVRLLGCCVEGDEKMLVYEYMPNKSLNAIIFDPQKKGNLDWKRRFNIIEGICRGLLYLHRDSRLRIIHRDLKASNILLDKDLNPKISDFGMARIFGHNEDQANTLRVVGTYGYMSPEYAMSGKFSEKSDIFSFGVLLLEIISGKSINSFQDDECLGLLGYAWKLWNENNLLQLIDATVSDSLYQADILKCMKLALLCVQEFPEERPSISSIMYMLHCDIGNLPQPKQPGFTQQRSGSLNEFHHSSQQYHSVNHISVTAITPR